MKFIHLSDLHLGKRVNGFSMLEDQKYILTEIINIIDSEKPNAVLIAGDVYDKSVPSAEAVEMLDEFLVCLAKRNLQVFIISGNHDSPERLAFGSRLIDVSGIHMSSGQYELKRRRTAENNRSQSGLELDVIDHYNGSERSVKTLSGGESFKASLSLALGLSDEIQSSAGGIKLDTMFVDEGFGSLDEESLHQAINTLAGLTEGNRLVGIISHVSELKDKIDKQIVVTKQKSGGSTVILSV